MEILFTISISEGNVLLSNVDRNGLITDKEILNHLLMRLVQIRIDRGDLVYSLGAAMKMISDTVDLGGVYIQYHGCKFHIFNGQSGGIFHEILTMI